MTELRDRMQNKAYDIIEITETWTNESVNNAELNIEEYRVYRKDRKEGRGGGLILYINTRLRACLNEELTGSEFEKSLWCNVELDHQRLLVGLCYLLMVIYYTSWKKQSFKQNRIIWLLWGLQLSGN